MTDLRTTTGCCGQAPEQPCSCRADADALARGVHAFVAHRVRHAQDAEDIAQEALVRLYRNVDTLRDAGALQGWAYRIARNAIVDHYRRSGSRPTPVEPDRVVEMVPPAPEPAEGTDVDLARCLNPLLARVPPTYRQALEMTDVSGMTQQGAARRLGLSTSGMKSRVQRGRRLLRAEVARCCEVALDSRGGLAEVARREPGAPC